MSITDNAREAAELKQQQRLQSELEALAEQGKTPESGRYADFDPEAPHGERHRVDLPDGSRVYGEFVSPNAPEFASEVAAYYSGNDKWLFDCL